MNDKKKAIELTLSIITNQSMLEYYRLQQYSIFLQSQLIEKIPEIWRKLFINDSPSPFQSINELKKELNELSIEETVEKLPHTIWKSLFTHCYHLYENHLLNICKVLQKYNDYKIKLGDLSGRGIFRAKDYLKKVAELEFPDTSSEWQQIKYFNKLRNIIVHNDDIKINDIDEALLNYINVTKDIYIDETNTLVINYNFISIAIDNYIGIIEKTKEIICPEEEFLQKHYSNIKKHLF